MIRFVRAIAFGAVLCACGEPTAAPAQTPLSSQTQSAFAPTPTQQWRLPAALREISGLAVSADGRLFAHDDERAIIYQIDPAHGRLVASFAVAPPEAGDFEGLAIAPDGTFWLVTSTGALLRFREGEDGARVPFERFDTGLGDVCEIEGLAYLAAEESLILACKRNQGRAMRDALLIYAWRPGAAATLWRELRETDVAAAAGVDAFRPSSVEVDGRTGDIMLLSARDGAVAQLDADGSVRSAWRLSAGHVQAEGLTLLSSGALVIADEGGDGRALLSIYERAHD